MKLPAVLLLNVAVVTLGLVVFAALQSGPSAEDPVPDTGNDIAALEDRIAALESQLARAEASRERNDSDVVRRLGALEKQGGSASESRERSPLPEIESVNLTDLAGGPRAGPITDDELRRFRKLQAAANKLAARDKVAKRVNAVVEKLGLALTDDQTRKLQDAYVAFRPRVSGMWERAKTDASERMNAGESLDWDEVIVATNAQIQAAFRDEIDEIVSMSDAETIANTMFARGK